MLRTSLYDLVAGLRDAEEWTKTLEKEEANESPVAAVDWSLNVPRVLPKGVTFFELRALCLHETRFLSTELSTIIGQTLQLEKLEVCHCGLSSTPPPEHWARLRSLKIVFLQRNLLTKWVDVERVLCAPSLQWLTLFENPIGSQPEFRKVVLRRAPAILAVDYWAVTDDERIAGMPSWIALKETRRAKTPSTPGTGKNSPGNATEWKHAKKIRYKSVHNPTIADILGNAMKSARATRFIATSLESVIPLAINRARGYVQSSGHLLLEMEEQLTAIHQRSKYCSAAYAIQSCWKTFNARKGIEEDHDRRLKVIVSIQRQARAFLWKKRMVCYLKDYLNDIEQLDLLLSAREMLALRASKRIEAMVRLWIKRRKDRQMTRKAATLLSRTARGYLVRKAFLRRELELNKYKMIHFPESCAWEFLVLLNVARQKCRLPPLPRGHQFDGSKLMAIRVPEMTDLAARNSSATRLVTMRNAFLARPQRANRYPRHLWDGPFHKLVGESSSERINRAYATIRRRGATVNNHCKRAFVWSCAPGAHPIDRQGEVVLRRLPKEDTKDFRDVYALGSILGEGPYGIAFDCVKRKSRDQATYVVKLVEHAGAWWNREEASRFLKWGLLAAELEYLQTLEHPNISKMLDVFIGDYFVYVVMDKFDSNLDAAVQSSKRLGRRALPMHVMSAVAAQMLSPVEYMHAAGVAHRDIKLQNYCIQGHLRGQFHIALVDILYARRVEPGTSFCEPVSMREYWAPEVCAKCYSQPADIWAIGIAIWYIRTSEFPFACLEDTISQKLSKADRMEDDFFGFVESLLSKDMKSRCTAAQALTRPFIHSYSEKHMQELLRMETNQQATAGAGISTMTMAGPWVAKPGDTAAPAELENVDVTDAAHALEPSASIDVEASTINVARSRRFDKIRRGDERYSQGEKQVLRVEDALDSVAAEAKNNEETLAYEWWTEERCVSENLCTPERVRRRSQGSVILAAPCAKVVLDAAVPRQGDVALLEFVGDNQLEEFLGLDVSDDELADLERLRDELLGLRGRLVIRLGAPVNVVDFCVLRISSPGGKYLVQVGQETAEEGIVEMRPRLPTVVCEAPGSGMQGLLRDIWRLVETEMGMTLDTFDIHLQGGVTQSDVANQSSFDSLPKPPAYSTLGTTDLCRRHFFEADIKSKESLGELRLSTLGLPEGTGFATVRPDGTRLLWKWLGLEECHEHDLPVVLRTEMPPEFEGFQGLDRRCLNREELPKVFQKHGVDVQYFGVGEARTLRQITAEVQLGITKLYEHSEQSKNHLKELRRYVEVLVVRVRNSYGDSLVSTTHCFDGLGACGQFHSFPKAVLRPFEDKIWAVRRTLRELGVPLAVARARFGARTAEVMEDPRYPGIVSVYLEQDVEVMLEDVDVASLASPDLGAARWFENAAPLRSIEDESVDLQLRELLEGSERNWPAEATLDRGSAIRRFMLEARRLGSRPIRPKRPPNGPVVVRSVRSAAQPTRDRRGPKFAESSASKQLKVYRDAVWLKERLLCYECDSLQCLESLISLLLRFGGLEGDAPLVKPVPFLVEKMAREVSATVCIQAAFRAHRQRCNLRAGLRFSVTMRRCALCIQNIWRWSIVRRRMFLLEGALQCIRAVKNTSLYIEERLLLSLNLINGVNRYPPILQERNLSFSWSENPVLGLVLVRADLRADRVQRTSSADQVYKSAEVWEKYAKKRNGGLPSWLWTAVPEMQAVGPDDPLLRKVNGLQGLLLEGLVMEPQPEHVISVNMPSLEHQANLDQSGDDRAIRSPALASSGGAFRFVELKFPSLAHAQRKALMLYLCSYSARHRLAVPLLQKSQLQTVEVCQAMLRLWDIYGLVWPQGDRTALYQLRLRFSQVKSEMVPFNGRDSWRTLRSLAWLPLGCKYDESRDRFVLSSRQSEGARTSSAVGSERTSAIHYGEVVSHYRRPSTTPACPTKPLAQALVAGSGLAAARAGHRVQTPRAGPKRRALPAL